ncbi:hypothetical protein AB0B45_28400 [Nonomuraea sp. NPDC049152]|uniref:DUF7158 domain-containing protein n=1 Tax=Nonomuraea sp. NPDC049152 TaxID=3154350 RepID=UPI0033F25A3E
MTHTHPHPAQVHGSAIGTVDGHAVPRDLLDARLRDLREGPLSAALPTPDSSEDRQMARWVTQVVLTEVLCEHEALARGLAPVEGPALDRLAAVELGSINASAYNGSPWVRAVHRSVAASARVPSAWSPTSPEPSPPLHLVRHALFADERAAASATADDLEHLGAISLDSLPSAIAGALRSVPYGTPAGPVRDPLGWHVAVARPAPAPARDPSDAALVAAAGRRAFARWLDVQRAARVELVPGLEHPGDPRQPDNHHKH